MSTGSTPPRVPSPRIGSPGGFVRWRSRSLRPALRQRPAYRFAFRAGSVRTAEIAHVTREVYTRSHTTSAVRPGCAKGGVHVACHCLISSRSPRRVRRRWKHTEHAEYADDDAPDAQPANSAAGSV